MPRSWRRPWPAAHARLQEGCEYRRVGRPRQVFSDEVVGDRRLRTFLPGPILGVKLVLTSLFEREELLFVGADREDPGRQRVVVHRSPVLPVGGEWASRIATGQDAPKGPGRAVRDLHGQAAPEQLHPPVRHAAENRPLSEPRRGPREPGTYQGCGRPSSVVALLGVDAYGAANHVDEVGGDDATSDSGGIIAYLVGAGWRARTRR